MGIELGNAYGKIEIDASGVRTSVDTATNALSGMSGVISGALSTAMGVLAAQAIPKLLSGMTGFVSEAMEAEEVQAQLAAVLESTNGTAGVTADMVNDLADSLTSVTRFGDEAIISGENILLTFTNIGEETFPAATQTMLDMSQALGQDLKSSAIQLGKALQDPVAGVSALSRVGVNFTDEQKAMIQSMVDAGDVAGAQALILKELQTEFGGSAEAAGKTFAGQMDILKNSLANVGEEIGMAVLPILRQLLAEVVIPLLPYLKDLAARVVEFLGSLQSVDIGAIVAILVNFAAIIWSQLGPGLALLWDLLQQLWTAALPLLQQALQFVIQHWQIFAAIGAVVGAVILALASPITFIIGAIVALATAWANNWGGIQDKVQAVINFIQPFIQAALAAITGWWTAHGDSVMTVWNSNRAVIETVLGAIWTVIQTVMNLILSFWNAHGSAIMAAWSNTWNMVKTVISNAMTIIGALFDAFAAAFKGDWEGFGTALRVAWDTYWNTIQTMMSTHATNIKLIVGSIIDSIVNLFKGTNWGDVGTNIIKGIANGITNSLKWVTDAARKAAQSALDAAKGFLGIHSPSAVMAAQVGAPMAQGMAAGWEQALSEATASMRGDLGGMVQTVSRDTNITQHFNLNAAFAYESPAGVRESLRFMEMSAR